MAHTILRLPEVRSRTGLSRSSLYNHITKGTFTKQVPIGERSVGWPESEVDAIVSARIAGQADEVIRQLVAKLEAARKKAT